MARTRSILFHGLSITLRRLPAFLWTYLFNLGLALAFCFPLYKQLSKLLDHSLAAQRISSGFDLSVALSSIMQLQHGSAGQAITTTSYGSLPTYLLIYLLLVPGTLFCYITRAHSTLSSLLRQGILHFWRFIRIILLTLIAAFFILGPLTLLQRHWARFVDEHFVGRPALLLTLAGAGVVLLIASLLRLYFDLVEVYTVQLGTHTRSSGRPDRRVRRTLGPAFRLLRTHLTRAWIAFLFLAILGSAAAFIATRTAMHMMAQSRVWPMFLVAQAGLFIMLFMRFWQRGAEASLVLQYPIAPEESTSIVPRATFSSHVHPAPPSPPTSDVVSSEHPHHVEMIYNPDPLTPLYPAPFSPDAPLVEPTPPITTTIPPDPIPNPEPAPPSLDQPDPGIFHRDSQTSHLPDNPDKK
ncbi:hypothetical protein [Edaphobacter albus]|uniref:hypothetical protein n=1 Tax=Edaphobacter sp. 4G125 TaxID=2763071 RepID=UPI00164612A4|nr:hypothetical protein [Edaphobacter sp. 4G125]QNI36183.1 hypothetical protein H7846_14505 [Edaphobacter sp. 4G125]